MNALLMSITKKTRKRNMTALNKNTKEKQAKQKQNTEHRLTHTGLDTPLIQLKGDTKTSNY